MPDPLVWRIPPWQPAVLLLIAAGCAAANLYADPPVLARVVTIAIGVAAVVMAVLALRMYLVVDEEGIGVRRMFGESSVDWPDVADVTVQQNMLATMTLRVQRRDGTYVDVPSSLILPLKPTGNARMAALLAGIARRVLVYGEPYRGVQ